jgi:oligoendopeptidase F
MRLCLTTALLVAAVGACAAARAEDIADRWNLGDVYPTEAAWNADADKLGGQLTQFSATCKGHLADSAVRLQQCMDLEADLYKRYARLALYSSELLAADTSVPASLALNQKSDLLGTRVGEALSFVDPEIQHAGRRRIDQFVAKNPGLRIYRFQLDRSLRAAAHTLDAKSEALIAKFGLISGTGQTTYGMLSEADMPWPKIKLSTGEEVTLDQAAYTKYREAPNPADRKLVMDSFFGTFKQYEHTFGVTLYSQMKQDKVYAEVHKYPDSITAALDHDNVPVAVVDTLIAQTHENLPTLQRYFRLRARMLGVPQMHYYDMYPPLVKGDYKFTLEQAKDLTLKAVAPLGSEYVETLRKGFGSRWMDAYPRPHKMSGAHMAGMAYDVHPYVLMNFNGDYESVTTLAHEWGHAMHSYLANHAQPFVTADYATFVAEIASTFNEAMLLDYMLKQAKSDDERLYYLGSALEGLRGTYFRQAMFAEFERDAHARADRGEPVTGEDLTKLYCGILKRYHGDAVAIDDVDCDEWAYIPHFYNSFYVYQYATSIAASSLFAQRVVDQQPGALAHYLDLLRAGGSGYPYDLVKKAGVDLATPAPYQAIAQRMNRIMDEIEAILAKKQQH